MQMQRAILLRSKTKKPYTGTYPDSVSDGRETDSRLRVAKPSLGPIRFFRSFRKIQNQKFKRFGSREFDHEGPRYDPQAFPTPA